MACPLTGGLGQRTIRVVRKSGSGIRSHASNVEARMSEMFHSGGVRRAGILPMRLPCDNVRPNGEEGQCTI